MIFCNHSNKWKVCVDKYKALEIGFVAQIDFRMNEVFVTEWALNCSSGSYIL